MINPLEDKVILELASVLAGPSVGIFFAEMGAKVIKVENLLTNGDVTRKWKVATESKETDISSYFSSINWNKYSIPVNLKEKEGLEIVYELVKKSDVVIVNYKPGDAEKLKVDYKTLSSLNPKIIYAHITGYGLDDPRAGYDAIIQAEAGFMYMNGYPETPPAKMPVALMDILAAHHTIEAILLALWQREKTGKGQFIHTSLFKAGIASLANQATNWLVAGIIPQRMGADHPNIVPYGTIFKCKDGKEIVLGVGNDKQFKKLCQILGKPELAENPKFKTNPDRVKNRDELKKILKELFLNWEREKILEKLNKEEIPAGAINNMKEVFETKQGKEMIIEGEIKDEKRKIKGFRHIAFESPDLKPVEKLKPPPHFGEDTIYILKNFLNYNDKKIKKLIEKKIVFARNQEI